MGIVDIVYLELCYSNANTLEWSFILFQHINLLCSMTLYWNYFPNFETGLTLEIFESSIQCLNFKRRNESLELIISIDYNIWEIKNSCRKYVGYGILYAVYTSVMEYFMKFFCCGIFFAVRRLWNALNKKPVHSNLYLFLISTCNTLTVC